MKRLLTLSILLLFSVDAFADYEVYNLNMEKEVWA